MSIGDSITSFGQSMAQRGSEFASSIAQNAANQAKGIAQNAAKSAINQGLSYVPGPLRGLAGNMVNQVLGGLLGGCSGGSMYSQPEDFNQLRNINKKLVRTEFVQEWNFRLEIEGQPDEFDLYIKDISHGGFEVAADEEKYGAATFSWPVSQNPMRISFTARDNYDLRVSTFLHNWYRKAIINQGVVGLPFGNDGYVKKTAIYHIKSSGEEVKVYNILSYPIQCGDVTRSHENNQFMEMPVTLVHFSTLYCR